MHNTTVSPENGLAVVIIYKGGIVNMGGLL